MNAPTEMLAAIRARPDDDSPRLVYADWLSEQGDPRGEFIQVQCAIARARWWDANAVALQVRSELLLRDHHAEWEPRLQAPGRFGWGFSRGFPSRVEARGSELLAAAPELIEKVPTITAAMALRFDVHPESFLSSPLLPRLNALFLHYLPQPPPTREVLLRVLLDDPRTQHVKRLRISYTYLGQVEWEALVASALLPKLEVLEVPLGNATDLGLAALMSAKSSLRSLGVANGRVGTGGARAIAVSASAKSIEELDLSWNRIGLKGARALAESEQLGRLHYLDLSHCQIGDEGCEAIAGGRLGALKALRLEQTRLTRKGALRLLEMPQLVWLALKDNGLDAETLARVKARFG